MSRILTLLMILMLVVAPSAMVSAAVCRHQDSAEHMLARASSDARIAHSAQTEETAASLAKKGTLSDVPFASLLADMLPPFRLVPPFHTAKLIQRPIVDENVPTGTSVRPLLEPPAA